MLSKTNTLALVILYGYWSYGGVRYRMNQMANQL